MHLNPIRPSPQHKNWYRRKTEDHFARPIPTPDNLDPDWRVALNTGLRPGEQPVWMIWAPYQAVLKQKRPMYSDLPWEFSPDWLLALTPDRLLLLCVPAPNSQPQVVALDLDSILSLQQGVILLYSWLTVTWATQGTVRQETIIYNAVGEPCFSRLVNLIRERLAHNPSGIEQANRTLLANLPYKFKSLIPHRMLLPGETVRQVIYRPALWEKVLGIFRKMIAPRLAMALTADYLLIAEEDCTGTEGSYGFTATYLPLANVNHTELQPLKNGLEWRVVLEWHEARHELKIAFPISAEAELRTFPRSHALREDEGRKRLAL
jgi:hypothetical protein